MCVRLSSEICAPSPGLCALIPGLCALSLSKGAVLPGQTETAPMRAYLDALPDQGERMLRRLPMGRMATPGEIAQTAVWLCSDESSYVSGVSLLADGALIAR